MNIIIGVYLCIYLIAGFYTELQLLKNKPLPGSLFEDFRIYQSAQIQALEGKDPYADRSIGSAFLYPPPSMLVVELFSHITPFFLLVSVYTTANIVLLVLMVYGIANHYNYSPGTTWYWYVLCLGFAPFFELLHIGQINVITLFGMFMVFIWAEKSPLLSGAGLGLAAATKITPIALLGYLLVNKRFRTIAVALAVILLLIVLCAWRYGLSPLLEYPSVFEGLLGQFPINTNVQSLVAKLAVTSLSIMHRINGTSPLVPFLAFFASQPQFLEKLLEFYVLCCFVISALTSFFGKQPKEPLFIVISMGMMLTPNIMWYHHYVFILLPMLIWMGWSSLDWRVVAWCLFGLLITQVDRYFPPYGLFIHLFGHSSLLFVLGWQIRQFFRGRKDQGQYLLAAS